MEDYILADPGGNITALVETYLAPEQRPAAAKRIMSLEPRAEQLGFISPGGDADVSLYMAGGEFCGNACLCAAAWYLERSGESEGLVSVSISGADKPVSVEMKRSGDCFEGVVDMPLPSEISSLEGMTLVSWPGISHLIASPGMSRSEAEEMIVPLCRRLGAEALGLMLFDREKMSLHPLVYVPGAGSLFWENSCASGTSALCAWKSSECGSSCRLELSQPGGSLSINAITENAVLTHLRLGGKVALGESISLKI